MSVCFDDCGNYPCDFALDGIGVCSMESCGYCFSDPCVCPSMKPAFLIEDLHPTLINFYARFNERLAREKNK